MHSNEFECKLSIAILLFRYAIYVADARFDELSIFHREISNEFQFSVAVIYDAFHKILDFDK